MSTTKTFITSSERQREVDIKANWARTRNRYGDQATDIRINSTVSSFPQSVDPFGPPLLTLNDQLRPSTKPPPGPAPMYRRLAIEQPVATAPPPPPAVVEITSSPAITKDSLLLSEEENDDDDDEPNSEIERITNVKEGENESSRPSTMNERPTSPFSQLFANRPAPTAAVSRAPPKKKSDSDDDDDEFIAMLKRK